jgi:ATP-dependent exoDNAse (exonuclease V) beta subunit
VNAAFQAVMDGDAHGLQARYVPLAPSRPDHLEQPSVVVLPVPEPYAQRYVAAKAIEQSLPDAVGAYVEWLVRTSNWTITERRDPTVRVPLEARHICILFRRFLSYGEDVTRPYVEALESRGLRHLLVGGKAFHDRDEIETLRAALMAIEWPDDHLSVFATLRGALFAIGDEDLLEYHHRFASTFHPFRVPSALPSHLAPIGEALTVLRTLHTHRNRRPVAETIANLLGATRAHVGFVLRPGGEQVLANVLHVAELARQYELDGGMSFRGFVDALQEAAAGGQAAEAPILEEGSDGVRLMTVHKAKGLEFPVVILADITARLTPHEAGRHIDAERGLCALRIGGWSPVDLVRQQSTELLREEKEGQRVAYVAATRARDLLVVPAVGDGPYEGGWLSTLNAAIYPSQAARRVHHSARGCPPFKSRDSVLKRPNSDPATIMTVCPGEHTFEGSSKYQVFWWSPECDVLPLGAPTAFGLRRDDLIVKDVPATTLRGQLDAYCTWRDARSAVLSAGRVPSLRVMTVSEAIDCLELPPSIDTIPVTVEEVSLRDARPGGVRYGTLVHAVLADVPLGNTSDIVVAQLAAAHGKVLGASDTEVAAARTVVQHALAHPVLVRAATAVKIDRCYRETPITYTVDGTSLIEGVVDLAFQENDGYTVVDFKTDRELEGSADRYRRQVQVYAAAVASATGKPARGILMRV